ncbi:hypothetical protein [Croceitalea vernalis]|uniref:Macroglobulin domain-containing protein n=1 Tax=Croceitalea vernalis TaxID=3075599 RepID=A0ABU3BHQ8_9FLAO|nr:hypothetical protein [Croceitalea sp. P007]MDT0621703.1 hypothetical protein [Croceitalea sp. P007]
MKKLIVFVGLLIGLGFSLKAQYVIKDGSELLNLQKLPQEKAYIDHTGPLHFSGEYLYYAFYCFNAQSNKLTNISKVAYVALVDENQNYIFEHKIKLTKGLGQGDFFISTDIPSGKYKLLGYTQWMKNSGLSQVFKDDIIIVNPYMVDQSSIIASTTDSVQRSYNLNRDKVVLDSSMITLSLDKLQFEPREKINLAVTNYKGYLGNGSYTIKVQKKDEIPVKSAVNAIAYATDYFNVDKQISQRVGDSLFLPEQRGELFYGQVSDANTGEVVTDMPIVLSIPGKEFLLKFSQTDENGNFYSYLRKDYKNPVAVIQIEDESKSYSIKKGAIAKLNTEDLSFSDFTLSKEHAESIKERSILNQIENQFFTAKPDSILQGDPIDPFDGGIPEVVLLDEYTRFPTLEETLVEVITNAGYRNGGKENDYVKVAQDFETFNEDFNSFPAIVLIDGVFIPNHEKIREFDARRIEKISLIRDQFRLGGKDYQGIVSIETFESDFLVDYSNDNSLLVDLDKPITKKNYYQQTYAPDEMAFSRVPDYRTLLYWKPQLVVEGSSYTLDFFTSDVEGTYEITFNGFTTYGKPLTIKKEFVVSRSTP